MILTRRNAISGAAAASFGVAAIGARPARAAAPGEALHLAFRQVDVFSPQPFRGNPLAVIIDADALDDTQMRLISRWTNLSETTFLLRPTDPLADYRVRIFSHEEELPFAGHPTLGTCHAWLQAGGKPRGAEIVQQCGVGRVQLRQVSGRLAFEAPPLRRSTVPNAAMMAQIIRGLGLSVDEIVAAQVLDGGLEQVAVMIKSRERLLALKPDWPTLAMDGIGLIAPWGGGQPDFEVRAFDKTLTASEDPVTGSFNASVARWLIGAGLAPPRYVVSQGTVLGRTGRVYAEQANGRIWIGGDVSDCVVGEITV